MANQSIEQAQMMVDQCLRDLGACANYVMVPLLEKMLLNAKEELAYAMAANR